MSKTIRALCCMRLCVYQPNSVASEVQEVEAGYWT